MKAKMLTVAAARGRILKAGRRLGAEAVPVGRAQGRTLREAVKAPRPMPPGDTSAMDGYAVCAADLAAAPATLEVIGEAPAGAPYPGKLEKGAAVRIFTGALVPKGADAVVIQENTRREGAAVTVLKAPHKGANIRTRGNDIRKGETLLAPGRALTARDVALAASANRAALRVSRRPGVALIATGDELVRPGGRLGPGAIINSNTPALAQLFEAEGADILSATLVKDRLGGIRKALQAAAEADLIVTLGGASVGDYDFVQEAFRAEGGRLDFWKIAVKPGKPFAFGNVLGKPFLGLPGNPVSVFVTLLIVGRPYLFRLQGAVGTELTPSRLPARFDKEGSTREEYLRARFTPDGIELFTNQSSGVLMSTCQSDGLVRQRVGENIAAGDLVDFLPYSVFS